MSNRWQMILAAPIALPLVILMLMLTVVFNFKDFKRVWGELTILVKTSWRS